MGKSILHKTWKSEQFREKWRDGERMRGFALSGIFAFDYDIFCFWESQISSNSPQKATSRSLRPPKKI